MARSVRLPRDFAASVLMISAALLVVAPASTLLLASPASAGGTDRSATAIIRSLAPVAPASRPTLAPRTVVAVRPVTVIAAAPDLRTVTIVIDRSRSLDFDVFFEFGSDRLTPAARASLADLGEALVTPELSDYDFLIAGHTDAVGSDGRNLDLSLRRARAVRQFLIETYPIAPARLYSAGFGEAQLRDPANPTAAVNRRVEVSLIASKS